MRVLQAIHELWDMCQIGTFDWQMPGFEVANASN
jgi:hypothetical protein